MGCGAAAAARAGRAPALGEAEIKLLNNANPSQSHTLQSSDSNMMGFSCLVCVLESLGYPLGCKNVLGFVFHLLHCQSLLVPLSLNLSVAFNLYAQLKS